MVNGLMVSLEMGCGSMDIGITALSVVEIGLMGSGMLAIGMRVKLMVLNQKNILDFFKKYVILISKNKEKK